MKKELAFIADTFMIETCKGEKKLFKNLEPWEMLNLKPGTILDISERLFEEYEISPKFLQDTLEQYNIQTIGKDALEKEYKIEDPQCMVSATRHYSWPKGAGE